MLLAMRSHNGQTISRKDGYLFVLSSRCKTPVPTDGTEAEFMIVAALGTHPKGLIVEPVTADHKLVEHTGFECAGSMCRTTASTKDLVSPGWLTPGRVGDLIPVAENVNAGYLGRTEQPRTPGSAYVYGRENRLAGLPSVEDIDPKRWAALIAWRKTQASRQAAAA